MKALLLGGLYLPSLLLGGSTLKGLLTQRYYAPIGVIGHTSHGLYQATITHTANAMPYPRVIYLPDTINVLADYVDTLPRKDYEWPEDADKGASVTRWKHSTLRRLAFTFVHKVLIEIIQSTNLNVIENDK